MKLINKKQDLNIQLRQKAQVSDSRIPRTESEELRIFIFANDTKDFHSNIVPGYWCQIIGRSWESRQIQGKVADECKNKHMA